MVVLLASVLSAAGCAGIFTDGSTARQDREQLEASWQAAMQSGRDAAASEQLPEAERAFREAVQIARLSPGGEARVISSLKSLAMLYHAHGSPDVALQVVEECKLFAKRAQATLAEDEDEVWLPPVEECAPVSWESITGEALAAASCLGGAFPQQGQGEFDLTIWFLVELPRTLPSGAKRISLLGLFHRSKTRDGQPQSWHLLNYFSGQDYQALFPLYYRYGAKGHEHTGIIPAYFSGPDYWVAPAALSGGWTDSQDVQHNWFVILAHYSLDRDGKIMDMHVGPYIQGRDYAVLLPLYYRAGPVGRKHMGIIPAYFSGPDYWVAPPLLAGGWTTEEGYRHNWLTPLAHYSLDAEGNLTSMHIGPYIQSRDCQLLLPIFYRLGEEGRKHMGILPAYFSGPDYWFAPPALSGQWTDSAGHRHSWFTPLFHYGEDASGRMTSMHVGPYMGGRDYQVLFPLYYRAGPEGQKHTGVIPAYFSGPNYWVVPPALALGWTDGSGQRHNWFVPLFHYSRDAQGALTSVHVGPYVQGENYQLLFPLYYRAGRDGRKHTGIIPAYFSGPDYWFAPPALSLGWVDKDGRRHAWCTPLFHRTLDQEGKLENMHIGPYVSGKDYQMLLPLFYRRGQEGQEHTGILPLYFSGPDYWLSPPVLSGAWTDEEGLRHSWVTPLFHRTLDQDGDLESMHVGPYFQGRNHQVLFPLFYRVGPDGGKRTGILPLYFGGPDYWLSPAVLSGGYTDHADSRHTWLTPLFHYKVDRDGRFEGMHIGPYVQGKDYHALLPLYYRCGPEGKKHFGLLPLYMGGPDYWAVPAALFCGWTDSEERQHTWITPLFHSTRDEAGRVESMHIGPYMQTKDCQALLPLYYRMGAGEQRHTGVLPAYFGGPNYWVVPPLLSAGWKTDDGARHDWYTPLFSTRRYPDGESSASVLWPVFNYRQGQKLDTSISMQCRPFVYQQAGEDYEFNFLWRLVSLRREGEYERLWAFPLWWSEQRREGLPSQFSVLGGLLARDCNHDAGTYRYRILWLIPITGSLRADSGEAAMPEHMCALRLPEPVFYR